MNNIDMAKIKQAFLSYVSDLERFHFDFLNPVFWILITLVFFIALRFWETKKSFSFSLVISLILLGSTKLESIIREMVMRSGDTFDPLIIRMPAVFIVFVIMLYYVLLR